MFAQVSKDCLRTCARERGGHIGSELCLLTPHEPFSTGEAILTRSPLKRRESEEYFRESEGNLYITSKDKKRPIKLDLYRGTTKGKNGWRLELGAKNGTEDRWPELKKYITVKMRNH